MDIALLWGCDQLSRGPDQGQQEDDRIALSWAAGTELHRELGGDGVRNVLVSASLLVAWHISPDYMHS